MTEDKLNPLNNEEYLDNQTAIILLSQLVSQMPLDAFIDRLNYAATVGPFLDPTLYKAAGERLEKIGRIAQALRTFQHVVRRELEQ